MTDPDHYAALSLSDRLQMLAFEAELATCPAHSTTADYE
jgi:hypothetical protein